MDETETAEVTTADAFHEVEQLWEVAHVELKAAVFARGAARERADAAARDVDAAERKVSALAKTLDVLRGQL